MKHNTKTKWLGNMAFEAQVDSHKLRMDAAEEFGGENQGPTPKPLLLTSLAGCTGMDITSLLKKMRVAIASFEVNISGELTEEHPKYYAHIHMEYIFTGDNLQRDKIEKAVKLSQERYCGVYYMLSQAADITHDIKFL
jgi:putative redox protein